MRWGHLEIHNIQKPICFILAVMFRSIDNSSMAEQAEQEELITGQVVGAMCLHEADHLPVVPAVLPGAAESAAGVA